MAEKGIRSMRMLRMPIIFKNEQFLRIWGNQLLLQVAFNMCNYTALLIIADRTHSVFAQAQFYAALTIPAFLVSLVAGPVVDMVDRRRVMIISNLLMAILFLMYVFTNGQLPFIMLIAFLTASCARFFIPAEAATIPMVVKKENLDHANAFFIFTLMGSVLVGYSIAGPIIHFFGGLGTNGELVPFFLGSGLLVMSFLIIYGFKSVGVPDPGARGSNLLGKMFYLLWQTFGEIKVNKKISIPILLLVFIELNVGILSVTLFEYVNRYLRLPLTSVSVVLIIPLITGLIIGIMFLSRIEKRFGHRLSIFLACIGIGMLFCFLGALPFFGKGELWIFAIRAFAITTAFVFGILAVIIAVQARTILQINARIEMQGRVFSLLDILIALAIPIPVLFLGFFADKISILAMLIFTGIVILIAVTVGNKVVFGSISKKSSY